MQAQCFMVDTLRRHVLILTITNPVAPPKPDAHTSNAHNGEAMNMGALLTGQDARGMLQTVKAPIPDQGLALEHMQLFMSGTNGNRKKGESMQLDNKTLKLIVVGVGVAIIVFACKYFGAV